jgi:hypothetical protein
MLYKITHSLVAIDPNLYLVKQSIMHTRNSNILQYQLFNTRTNYFKYRYFPHTVVVWNSLSHATLMASTLDQFKSLAQSHYYWNALLMFIYIYIYILRQSINGDDYLSCAVRTDKKFLKRVQII